MHLLLEHGPPIDNLVVEEDAIHFSCRDGRVHRLPLGGGSPEVVFDSGEGRIPTTIARHAGVTWLGASWKLWRIDRGGPVEIDVGLRESLDHVIVGESETVVLGDDDSVLLVDDNRHVRWRASTFKWPYGAAFEKGGTRILVWTWDGLAYVVDTSNLADDGDGPVELEYPAHPNGLSPIFSGGWSAGRVLVAGQMIGDPRCGRLHSWVPGSDAWLPNQHDQRGAIHALAVSPDGSRIAVGGQEGRVDLLDAELTLERSWDLGRYAPKPLAAAVPVPAGAGFHDARSSSTVLSLGISPDQAHLYAGTAGGSIVRLPMGSSAAA